MSNRLTFAATWLACAVIGLVWLPATAFAEAVTYTGTLGGRAIVLELSEGGDGPVVGRYSDQSNGADIPLHALSAGPSDVVLAEEAPCTPALCVRPDGNLVLEPPLGGQFSLRYAPGNATLTGTWRAPGSAGAALPVELSRFGQRAYERDAAFPYGSFLWVTYDDTPITPETSPYDYAKMQVALTEGPVLTQDGATYREVIDPRTKFAAPRIVSLPGGGDTGPLNALLEQRRWATNFSGFACLGMDFLSGGWMPVPFGHGATSLGGIDKERIAIDYVSDRVMTIRQLSHRSCGGGDPSDFVNFFSYDVRAGHALDLSQILNGWDAATDDPTGPLVDWVIEAYRRASTYDADFDAGCLDRDDLTTGLQVNFARNDVALFQLDNVEDAGCIATLVSVPLSDIKALLTDQAADYFPSLGS